MKKLSRFVLCLAAVISSVAFCFPAFASELEFGVEAGTEPAAAALPIEEESVSKNKSDASLHSDTGWEIFVPEFDGAISFRTAMPAGLRMRASVRQSIYRIDDDIDVEAGILVTLDKNLSGELTFESAESEKYPVVKGVGYLQENGTKKIDKLIPDMESGTTATFTAIVTGVPDNALGYTSVFAFRPYFTIAGVNYYGDTRTASLYAAAQDYKASESYVENGYIEHILAVSEAEKEPETLPDDLSRILLITPDENGEWVRTDAYDATLGMRPTYVHAWVDGEIDWFKVNTDASIYPALSEASSDMYLNKLCVYTVDENGFYKIYPLANVYSEQEMSESSYIGLNKDMSKLEDEGICLIDRADSGNMDWLIYNETGSFSAAGVDFKLIPDENTVFLIRNQYTYNGEQRDFFLRYSSDVMTGSIANTLKNVQMIVSDRTDSTDAENLLFYYAETSDNKEFDTYSGLPASFTIKRIIKDSAPKIDSDKNYYYEYTVSNPYTGMLETMKGNKRDYTKYDEARYAVGDIVDVVSDGTVLAVNDQDDTLSGSVLAEESQYWILDYDAEGGKITVTALPTNEDEVAAVENGTAQVYTLKVSDIYYVGGDTPVTRISNGAGMDLIRWGSIEKASVSNLGSQNNKFKAYTTYTDSATDPLKNVYGKHIKAYIAIDWENANNHTVADENTGCNGIAQFVTIICNSDEPTYRCNLK